MCDVTKQLAKICAASFVKNLRINSMLRKWYIIVLQLIAMKCIIDIRIVKHYSKVSNLQFIDASMSFCMVGTILQLTYLIWGTNEENLSLWIV